MGQWVHSEKVSTANRTEKVGAFRVNKTQGGGGGLYRGAYPYCFNMGVPPPGNCPRCGVQLIVISALVISIPVQSKILVGGSVCAHVSIPYKHKTQHSYPM